MSASTFEDKPRLIFVTVVILGAPLITGGLFWFGFTTYPSIHWIVPITGSFIFGLG